MNYLKLSIVIVQQDARCNCKHYELPCTKACGPCQTENYDNPSNNQEIVEEGDNDN